MTALTPPSKAQELADALFRENPVGMGSALVLRSDLRDLAEAAYRLGKHDGWDEGFDTACSAHGVDRFEYTNPYGGDDE